MKHPKIIALKTKRFATQLILLGGAWAFVTGAAAATNQGSPEPKTLIQAIVLGMGRDAPVVTDARYDPYFKGHSAAAGIPAVIAAGRFYINGLVLPSSEAAYAKQTPDGYLVNQVRWLYRDATGTAWRGGYKGQKTVGSYAEAALAVATGIVPGLEVRLYDSDGDGLADLVEADYKEGVQVERVTHRNDDSYSVERGDIDTLKRTGQEGRVFDAQHFSGASGERIDARNFDKTIGSGDIALFWYGPDGWVMQRAKEARGVFIDGTDHRSYNIGGTSYADAMRFSRDNLFISNRPGEYANALMYFGLNGNAEGLASSLWLVPTTDPKAQGAPVGISSGASAHRLLAKAVAVAKNKLSSVAVSRDGRDVPAKALWALAADHDQVSQAISRAEEALASASSPPALLDYQIYLLYLTLHGSDSDIGARFGGYRYAGFENGLKPGTQTPSPLSESSSRP